MKNKLNIFFLFLTVVGLIGCSEDEPLMYQEDSRVYFYKRTGSSERDSINYSFAFSNANISTDTVALRFRIIGFSKDYDRQVTLKLSENSTAKEGYHFKIDNLIIPANSSDGTADLIFFRKAGLKDSTVFAQLNIAENDFFKIGYKDFDSNSKLDRLTYRFTITDKLAMPSNWQTLWFPMFGEFSNRKILFLTELMNYTAWNVSFLFPQDQSNMINKARIGLYEYEKANGPMIDENGNRVLIP